jgi:hypothetical protein
MGVGAMFPFCRGHSEKSTNDHEPWSFGEEVGDTCLQFDTSHLFLTCDMNLDVSFCAQSGAIDICKNIVICCNC